MVKKFFLVRSAEEVGQNKDFFNKEGTKEMDMTNEICKECRLKKKLKKKIITGKTTNMRAHLTVNQPETGVIEGGKNKVKQEK